MNDFLNFLNTADMDALTRIPGITRPLAGSLISARPFDAPEDCLKVRGMGKALLGRMQTTFEAESQPAAEESAPPEESRAMVAVESVPPVTPAPAPQTPPAEKTSTFGERFGKALLNFFRAFIRLVLVLAFILSIAAALYFGLPYLNQKLIVPVEKNSVQIKTLQAQLDETKARVDALEAAAESQSASLARLEEMQAALEKEVSTQNNSVMQALAREMKFTRVIELLARARLYLAQSNFGLAQTDVESARDLLSELKADAPETQQDALADISARLDLALKNLPDLPVIAADDVNIAWELALRGLPQP